MRKLVKFKFFQRCVLFPIIYDLIEENRTTDFCKGQYCTLVTNEFTNAIQRYSYLLAYLLKMVELTHQKEMQEVLHFLLFTF